VSDVPAEQADRCAKESAKNASKNPGYEQLDQVHLDTRTLETLASSESRESERGTLE
jgi:hypothetical protein